MNKLNEMNIADLSDNEVNSLRKYEEEMNSMHQGDEIYLLALKK